MSKVSAKQIYFTESLGSRKSEFSRRFMYVFMCIYFLFLQYLNGISIFYLFLSIYVLSESIRLLFKEKIHVPKSLSFPTVRIFVCLYSSGRNETIVSSSSHSSQLIHLQLFTKKNLWNMREKTLLCLQNSGLDLNSSL